jgi:hypothetical protein
MTRERLLGFLLGISVGTAVGFYLRPPEANRREARPNNGRTGGNGQAFATRDFEAPPDKLSAARVASVSSIDVA